MLLTYEFPLAALVLAGQTLIATSESNFENNLPPSGQYVANLQNSTRGAVATTISVHTEIVRRSFVELPIANRHSAAGDSFPLPHSARNIVGSNQELAAEGGTRNDHIRPVIPALLTPRVWTPNSPYNAQFHYAGRHFYADNSRQAWSLSSADDNTIRFELRDGDHFNHPTWPDPPTMQRTELGDVNTIAVSNQVRVEYEFLVESGAAMTSTWCVIGQWHSNAVAIMDASPPIEIGFNPVDTNGEHLLIGGHYSDTADRMTYQTLYKAQSPIVRGQWHSIRLDFKIDNTGATGFLKAWINGVQIIGYTGPLGYNGQTSLRWRLGIYRQNAKETLAVQYRNLSIIAAPTLPVL
jgi:hypothetical protein